MNPTEGDRPAGVPASTSLLARERLDGLVDEAHRRRLTIIVAEAGFGKSTLLGSWTSRANFAWYTVTPEDRFYSTFAQGLFDTLRLRVPGLPSDIRATIEGGSSGGEGEWSRAQAFAAELSEALATSLKNDLLLILDDLHELGLEGSSVKLVEALCRGAPQGLHIVLSGRTEPPFPVERLRGQGEILEIQGPELTFKRDETSVFISEFLGEEGADLADQVHELTGGWPAALRLTLEALSKAAPDERHARLMALGSPGGQLFAYLAEEVFEAESEEVRALLRAVAPLERFTPALCRFLGFDSAIELVPNLARRGLFVEADGARAGWFSLGSLTRGFVLEYLPQAPDEISELHGRAAEWFEAHGFDEDALHSVVATGDESSLATFLLRRGSALLARGRVEAVLQGVERLPAWARNPETERLAGEACQIRGDWGAALEHLGRAAQGDDLPANIGWRIALIHYLRGELDQALAVTERVDVGDDKSVDAALMYAWTATIHWARGDYADSQRKADLAFAIASTTKDDAALAATHTTLAMLAAVLGDRRANDEHYLRALEHAERAGDVLHIIRIRNNRGSYHMEEGYYEEALAELGIAISLADLTGFTAYRALCFTNRGETRFHLGRLEEALADLETAKSLYQRIGSRNISYCLGRLGDVYRTRGDFALARACYLEAIEQSEVARDVQGLVPALTGLARIEVQEDPELAQSLVERALSYGTGLDYVPALLTRAWVALEKGQESIAAEVVAEAMEVARTRRDRAGIAAALEVQARVTEDRGRAVGQLDESISVWQHIRNPIGEIEARLAKASLLGASEGLAIAADVAEEARTLGARRLVVEAEALSQSFRASVESGVRIETLGGFRVVRADGVVPVGAWQSKKARGLLKLLVARRGHPTPKEVAMEVLWPGDDLHALRNRFSVAVTTVRSVLDPERSWPQDYYIATTAEAVSLVTDHVFVDVESFFADAEVGLSERRIHGAAGGNSPLQRAEAAYAGDFLEEDAYEDWAVPVREQARATYLQVVRMLARDAIAAGDPNTAQRYLLRILERDPFDEEAHLSLVRVLVGDRRHGEARRAYRLYCSRMEDIEVEAAPFPTPAAAFS